jgi:tRNA (guanine-N7-)-methyltransferase
MQHPDIAMIGCEPFVNGVAKLLARLPEKDYGRVKVWHDDVRHILEKMPPSFFSKVFILFSDPWPKKKRNHRRLISKEFIDKLLPTLQKGALLYIASDDPSYVEQIQEILYSHPTFSLKEGPPSADPGTWGPHPQGWPYTSYEQKALRKGHPCAYMVFEKRG